MNKNKVLLNIYPNMWDIAQLNDLTLCEDFYDRCVRHFMVDVFLNEDIPDEEFDLALQSKQPRIRFFCVLCYEDFNSSDLHDVCDYASSDLATISEELLKFDPDASSMLYIDRYEVHSDIFDVIDVRRIMKLLTEFVYNKMNINPEYLAMLQPTNANYNIDCYPMGMMDNMVELESGVYIREVDTL